MPQRRPFERLDQRLAQLQPALGRGEDPAEAEVFRYSITPEGADSLNRLAMGLSRILTPKADLPRDPVLLEDQDRFESPSIYPWTVEVFR